MKTTLTIILSAFILSVSAQDTVYIRNTQLPAKNFFYLLGAHEFTYKDSASRKFFKRLRNSVAGLSNATVVVIDSIPGKWAERFVEHLFSLQGVIYEQAGARQMIAEFKLKAQLSEFITRRETVANDYYKSVLKDGKDWAEQ